MNPSPHGAAAATGSVALEQEVALQRAYLEIEAARFIVPLGLSEHLARLGVRGEAITELDWWQSTDSGALRITLVPALHYSGRGLRDGGRSFWGGFVLQQAGETFYYSGDSAWGGRRDRRPVTACSTRLFMARPPQTGRPAPRWRGALFCF